MRDFGEKTLLRRVRKIHVFPSVRMEKLGPHWEDFHKIWYPSLFGKSVEKIQVALKSDEINGYFTWTPMYIFNHNSLGSS